MNCCIVYSSCTGNTRAVAEALARGTDVPCFPVRHAPNPQGYDVLALGFWVRKGLPDERSRRYMARVREKRVFVFGTLGAWPDSEHARRCMAAARALLEANGNTVLGGFLCQGRVNPRVVAATQRKGTHTPSEERLARLREAARHPNAKDCLAARLRWQDALRAAQEPEAALP
ncbi:MAG: flavodoxin [Desulfovibrio desulfuricans]|jgi:flavodoxin|nr:flavodoxin [Desulfovibrio desulfuricans]